MDLHAHASFAGVRCLDENNKKQYLNIILHCKKVKNLILVLAVLLALVEEYYYSIFNVDTNGTVRTF